MELIKPNPNQLIHFSPSKVSGNVRCLNGSAHSRTTTNIGDVTCSKCKDEKHLQTWWANHFLKVGDKCRN